MQLAWTTDPHFDHVNVDSMDRWFEHVASQRPCGLIVTGDLSEGSDVVVQLRRLALTLGIPIYFVLGNHDFYQSSIARTRQQVVSFARDQDQLFYLTDVGPIQLAEGVYLTGDDGWGDATIGNYEASPIRLRDFEQIEDFRDADPTERKAMLQREGADSAARLRAKLESIPMDAAKVLIATHLPPFAESCWYQGRTTDEFWAPFFVCGSIGKMLLDVCSARSHCDWIVLCGHTHHDGVATLADNLTVYTGAACYGDPGIEAMIQVEANGVRLAPFRGGKSTHTI
ncbi:metallophosphoesterase family protein [Novipirellula artificiosorum]|uniref:Calcineurin-like phosphoesterase n=1 Tax=Novipirellula artificiosorum TaxID=2528016 RepID=A0A5C6E6A0_9BACT|nr:metallophosphoesterase [Novipirellula artificiosorum]TWU42699.1 Calcineurin-like phosphoesterase [Novipirellula artificiosorum]